MKTSIVIPVFNKIEYTKLCIESIRKYTDKDSYEIIIIDNNSSDGTKEWLKNQDDLLIIENKENLGFTAGANQGFRAATGNNLLILGNDTIVSKNWLKNLINCLYSDESIGAVGPLTNSCSNYQAIEVPYRTIEEFDLFSKLINSNPSKDKWQEKNRLIAFCLIIKREVFEKVGLFDEIFSPGNFEDDDWSLRIRLAKYKMILAKDTFVHHFGSVSFKENPDYASLLERNLELFVKKWNIKKEDYYNDSIDLQKVKSIPILIN